MSVIKCKMCGGDLIITPGSTICECEYCGSKQTIPNTDDEKRLKLYERANKLRFNCEFDKAAGVYESIVSEFQDEAEAYWGLVLCKYGIEYVDDPGTGKKIPTCHRSSFDSVMDDGNFELVMENADAISRGVYREEAKQIEELRKGIIEVSSKEEPYDIFICYKETADDGQRTIDSVIAQDVYDALIEEGYKVFFSRITLEEKLGQEYEPYIFAALNSAKVMLAFGTQYDYYNAVWVKNEWSRFLQLMESGQKKTLIPCYKNIDAYDMPKEFAKLQAQDMGKVGAIQDLVRGIKKIIPRDEKNTDIKETIVSTGNESIEPLLKRAFMFLDDGEFAEAEEYCERVLDMDPENAQAYLGKLMVQYKVRYMEQLSDCDVPFDDSSIYQKVVRFADDQLVETLKGYLYEIETRNEEKRLEKTYNEAVSDMKNAGNTQNPEQTYLRARDIFSSISEYKDSANLSRVCADLAEESRKTAIYDSAKSRMREDSIEGLEFAINNLKSLEGWNDSEELIASCEKRIEELKDKQEAERQEQHQREEQARLLAEKASKKRKMITVVVFAAAIIVCCGVIAYKQYEKKVLIPNQKYEQALSLMEESKYVEAISIFNEIADFKDCSDEIDKCSAEMEAISEEKRKVAEEKIEADDFDGAVEALSDISDEDIKSSLIDSMVEKLKKQYVGANGQTLINANANCLKLYEVANAEQQNTIMELNDKRCIITALNNLGSDNVKVHNIFEMVMDQERYKDDIDACMELYDAYRRISLSYSTFESTWPKLKYDSTSHYFKIEMGDASYYVFSYTKDSMKLGKEKDAASVKWDTNTWFEEMSVTTAEGAIKLFEDL